MCRVFEEERSIFNKQGFKPKLYLLDNEASTSLKDTIEDNETEYQLVPPPQKGKIMQKE